MQKFIIALVLLFIPSLSVAQYVTFAYPVNTEIGIIQEEEMAKLPQSLVEQSQYYVRAAYASQKVVDKCASMHVMIKRTMQDPQGEEPVNFSFDYVQTKVLSGLNNDAAEAINKRAYAYVDTAIVNAQKRFDFPYAVNVNPVSWCRIAGPKVVQMLLYKFNDTDDQETTDFNKFVVAKDQYLKAVQELNTLNRR